MQKLKKIKVSEKHDMLEVAGGLSTYPPSFHVGEKQMPEIKDWEVGKKYKLMIEVEQKSLSQNESGRDASFDIVAYAVMEEKDFDKMSDEEMEMEQGKALSNK